MVCVHFSQRNSFQVQKNTETLLKKNYRNNGTAIQQQLTNILKLFCEIKLRSNMYSVEPGPFAYFNKRFYLKTF